MSARHSLTSTCESSDGKDCPPAASGAEANAASSKTPSKSANKFWRFLTKKKQRVRAEVVEACDDPSVAAMLCLCGGLRRSSSGMNQTSALINSSPSPNINTGTDITRSDVNGEVISGEADDVREDEEPGNRRDTITTLAITRNAEQINGNQSSISPPPSLDFRTSVDTRSEPFQRPHQSTLPSVEPSCSYNSLAESGQDSGGSLVARLPESASCSLREDVSSFRRYPLLRCGSVASSVSSVMSSNGTLVMTSADTESSLHSNDSQALSMAAGAPALRTDGRYFRERNSAVGGAADRMFLVSTESTVEDIEDSSSAVGGGGVNFTSGGIINSGGELGGAVPRTIHTQVDYVHCLVPDLQRIATCSYYWGVMDRYEAERLLDTKPEGTFLLRDSAQDEFLFSVSFRRYSRSLHARIEQWNHRFSFDSHDPSVFSSPSVCQLIEHYKDPASCMFFEPMLTTPLPRTNPFSLQALCRTAVCAATTYDGISYLPIPKTLRQYLQYYHYKQKVRVRRFEAAGSVAPSRHPPPSVSTSLLAGVPEVLTLAMPTGSSSNSSA